MDEAPKLTKREEDLQWVRGIWNKAGEKLAKKLTQNDENGIAYTLTDAMEIIADDINARIDMYENPMNEDGTKKTESEIEEGKEKADYLKGTRYHQTEQLAVSILNERIGDMNTFNEAPRSESAPNPEALKARLTLLQAEADQLRALIIEKNENIDVELGSEAYIDYGYTARLRDEIQPEIEKIESKLRDIDDQNAANRDLNI